MLGPAINSPRKRLFAVTNGVSAQSYVSPSRGGAGTRCVIKTSFIVLRDVATAHVAKRHNVLILNFTSSRQETLVNTLNIKGFLHETSFELNTNPAESLSEKLRKNRYIEDALETRTITTSSGRAVFSTVYLGEGRGVIHKISDSKSNIFVV